MAGEGGGLRAQVNKIGGYEGVWHLKFLQKQKPRVEWDFSGSPTNRWEATHLLITYCMPGTFYVSKC